MNKLSIQLNETEQIQRCEICGQEHPRNVGPALYLTRTGGPVCLTCGQESAPELAALLAMGAASNERTAGINWADAGSGAAE